MNSERAINVLDALPETEAGTAVTRYHVDGGVSDLVFAFCLGLGFAPAWHYGVLRSVMGDRLDAGLIRRH